MPYPNEHACRVKDPKGYDSFARKTLGPGVSIILGIKAGKSETQAYRFSKTTFTPAAAKAWLTKNNVTCSTFEPASTTVAATNWLEATKAWAPGKHKLYINGEPKVLAVPKETIIPTFRLMRDKLNSDGINMGIEHFDEALLKRYPLLKKLDPSNIGKVKKIGTDGEAIYILEKEITNPAVQELEANGELPAVSIQGPFESDECERNDIDYVFKRLKGIDRIDYVERGGCQECLVKSEPNGEMLLMSKSSQEDINMVDKPENEPIKGADPVEPTGEPTGEPQAVPTGEPVEPEGDPEPETEIGKLREDIDKLTTLVHDLMETKPAVPQEIQAQLADLQEDKLKTKVVGYIKAGLAVPAQEESLMEMAKADPKALDKMMKAAKPVVDYEIKGGFAKDKVIQKKLPDDEVSDEEYNKAMKQLGLEPDE